MTRNGSWFAASADTDWLALEEDAGDVAELFGSIHPFPAGGANSIRHEIVARTFSSALLTSPSHGLLVIEPGGDPLHLHEGILFAKSLDAGRVIAFSIPSRS